MEKKYLIGIDAGTTAIKAVLFDLRGRQIDCAEAENQVIHSNQSWNEQDMEQLWQSLAGCVRRLAANGPAAPEEIAAIGLTAQGEGLWTLDGHGEAVRRAILWNDGRAAQLVNALREEPLYQQIKLTAATYLKPGSTLTLIKWFAENEPERYAKTRWIFTCKDYIRFKMTGKVNWELTDASCSCLDIAACEYAAPLFHALGIPEALGKLPPLLGGTDCAGCVTEEAAALLGLCPGIPVSGGMIDIVATAAGAGAVKTNTICTILGTTGMNFVVLERYEPDLAFNGWERHMVRDKLIKGQGMMSAMPNQNWVLREIFGAQEITAELFDQTGPIVSQMQPGEGGLLYLPHIDPSGERAPFFNPNAAAQLMGIKTSTTRHEILRAVMDGVAMGIRDCLQAIPGRQAVYLTGGGAKSPVWRQIIADCTGRDVLICEATELAAKGAALSAALMAGIFDSCDSADDFFQVKCVVRPRESYTARYDRIFPAYKRAQQSAEEFWQWRTAYLRGES